MTKDQAQIISQTPGRIRLRLPLSTRESDSIESIATSMKQQRGVARVRFNADTGSLTIFYSEDTISFSEIRDFLHQAGVFLSAPAPKDGVASPEEGFVSGSSPTQITSNGFSEAATEITAAVAALNQRVNRVTDGAADLRFLVPLGFGSLALRQLLLKGIQLDIIPWYVFAWYAFDSFIKLHYTKLPDAPDRENKSPD